MLFSAAVISCFSFNFTSIFSFNFQSLEINDSLIISTFVLVSLYNFFCCNFSITLQWLILISPITFAIRSKPLTYSTNF